jgi:hypothetical protein
MHHARVRQAHLQPQPPTAVLSTPRPPKQNHGDASCSNLYGQQWWHSRTIATVVLKPKLFVLALAAGMRCRSAIAGASLLHPLPHVVNVLRDIPETLMRP